MSTFGISLNTHLRSLQTDSFTSEPVVDMEADEPDVCMTPPIPFSSVSEVSREQCDEDMCTITPIASSSLISHQVNPAEESDVSVTPPDEASPMEMETTPAFQRTPTLNNDMTPSSALKVVHVRGKSVVRSYKISTPYRKIVKSIRYRKPQYTARSFLKAPVVREATLEQLKKVIRHECELLCKEKPSPSYLSMSSVQCLMKFEWSKVMQELHEKAPVFVSMLESVVKTSKLSNNPNPMICMAAAILLKARSKKMCRVQKLVAALLYSGHAAKGVFTRLAKLGVSVTHSCAVNTVQKMCEDHDLPVCNWRDDVAASNVSASPSKEVPPIKGYVLVGDNVDKNVNPREMRVDNQLQSLHYFHTYAAKNRCDSLHLDNIKPIKEILDLPLSIFLPTTLDCIAVRNNYVVLVSRMIVNNFPAFSMYKQCVPLHVPHKYSCEMSEKSEIVPVGVITKNEIIREEMCQIMQELQKKYTPVQGPEEEGQEKLLNAILFYGDQLTKERSQKCQEDKVSDETSEEALLGLEPAVSDWHAEANFLQVIFQRLYKAGSSTQGGTLMQLRNLINRRNILSDIDGKFNEALDFFQLVVVAHTLAASMHFFGMSEISDQPTRNALPKKCASKWPVLKHAVERLMDRYVMVGEMADMSSLPTPVLVEDRNPHAERIMFEHNYASAPVPLSLGTPPVAKRILPLWVQQTQDEPAPTRSVKKAASDGVNRYASAVLNSGLLLLELRDGIHEGDGPRVIRCWKLMMLYWRHGGHTKYALEALHLLGAVNATATERAAHEITWCRFVNNVGGAGNNLPVDLYMEHLNRTLKSYIGNVRANVSEASIVRCGKSLHTLMRIVSQFDLTSGVRRVSLYHTTQKYGKDLELILKELLVDSYVFDYIPGRCHHTFKSIQPHITSHMDIHRS